MPWTRRQVRYLLSNVSPLSAAEKRKMQGELHANPALGHARKGRAKKRKFETEAYQYGRKVS